MVLQHRFPLLNMCAIFSTSEGELNNHTCISELLMYKKREILLCCQIKMANLSDEHRKGETEKSLIKTFILVGAAKPSS